MNSKIRKALQKDDVAKLEAILEREKNIDLNEYSKDGLTPLLFAIECGSQECSNYLINKKNVNIFLKDKKNQENALMKCILAGNDMLNVGRLLLSKKINVDEKNIDGKTCLHLASELNFVKGVECLLRHDANINVLDNERNTPLMGSIKYRSYEAAMCLIDNYANINIKDKNEDSVLHICAKEHVSNITKYILATNRVNTKNCVDKENNTPLHIAAKHNVLGLCDLFLQYKFDPYLKNKDNETYADILLRNEQERMLEREKKQQNSKEKEMKKKKKMEEAMGRTEVSKFLKEYNLEEFIPVFYNNKYFYLNSSFLNVEEETLKKMHLGKNEITAIYDSIEQYLKKEEEESLEYQLRNQHLIEEQKRNRNLKYVSIAVSIIFASLFIYSVVLFLYNKYKNFF